MPVLKTTAESESRKGRILMTINSREQYENAMKVLHHEMPDFLPDFGNCGTFVNTYGCTRRLNPADGYMYDAFGVKFHNTPIGPIPDNTATGNFELEDITEWERIIPKTDLDAIDWEEENERMLSGAVSLNGNSRENLLYNVIVGYLWDELHYMMGFENALYSVAAEPEATRDCLCAMADFYIEVMERQFRTFKPDIAMVMDHVANAKTLLMSPDSYREVIKPAEKRIFDYLNSKGYITEIHVDGYIEPLLADYAEIGVQVIQPFQVMNDIQAAKDKYNFIAIGGWDAFGPGNMEASTEEEVRGSVRRAMDDYGKGGGYMFWNSGVLPDGTSKKDWLIDEAIIYGKSYYQH